MANRLQNGHAGLHHSLAGEARDYIRATRGQFNAERITAKIALGSEKVEAICFTPR